MLDEENDNRIREAANQYHPAYDDIAWVKMEQMLDEHLPQKKTRRRIIFFLPLMLLLGGLIFFIISDNEKNHSSEFLQASTKSNTEKSISAKPSSANSSEVTANTLPYNKPGSNNKAITEKLKNDLQLQPTSSGTQIKENTIPVSVSIIDNPNKKNLPGTPKIVLKQQSPAETNNGNGNAINRNETTSPSINIESQNENNIIADKNENNTVTPKANNQTTVSAKTEIKEEEPTMPKIENGQPETIKKKTKSRNGFQNNFGITLSAGPDASGVRVDNVGKLTIKYGAGLSYPISNQFAIRSGFYVSKKIYSAGPNDYHEASGSAGGYDYLKNVDANCTVYEIPINFDYSFGKVKNHNWFVSTGFSSYLMKKETYDYYYKTPAGQSYNKNWTISNKNQHFFSVLNLSGGYQYFFNKQFSIMAEPYVGLPLSGIGAGKVKLNSGGILFTLKAKPFSKKR